MNRYNLATRSTALAIVVAACAGEIASPETRGAAGAVSPGLPFGAATGVAGVAPSAAGSGAPTTTAKSPAAAGGMGRLNLAGSPQYFRVVALTKNQWRNSVKDTFGLMTPPASAQAFQDAVSGTTDFTNNELVLDVDSRSWSDYQAAAEEVAHMVSGDPAVLSKLYAGADGAGFIASVGRRLFRRPLTAPEVARLQPLFDMGATSSGDTSSFALGAEMVLAAMLQSPHFLYRTELGAAGTALSGYELAAKLSLWLRDTSPDASLLDAAERGELDTAAGVAAVATKMLEEPVALGVMRQFHGQLLHFGRFSELSKVGVPAYDPAINNELMESAYLFFDRVFSADRGLADVFLSTSGFVGPHMAPFYGLPASGSGLTDRELGAGRVGFFTQLPYVMLYAHNDEPDAIHRGVSMALDVLCAPLGPPAATIPPLPMRMPGQTNRKRVDAHTSVCGGACHNDLINPMGFAFENFDGMGQYRTEEKHPSETLPIDASGSFNFIDGMKSWNSATELMQLLAAEPQTHLCYAKKLASFGLQRDIVEADMPLLQELAATSQSGSIKQVIVKLVETAAFRTRSGGMP
jgi:hypothetical protein